VALIDAHRDQFGVEPICQVLEVAPSTYYAAKSRPTSARQLRDEKLKAEIARVHKEKLAAAFRISFARRSSRFSRSSSVMRRYSSEATPGRWPSSNLSLPDPFAQGL
jgi:uncharacterized protein YciW